MSPVEIGALSVVAIVTMVYLGVYIPVALGLACTWVGKQQQRE